MRTPNKQCVICNKPLYRRPSQQPRYFACKEHREQAKRLFPITDKQQSALSLGRKKGTNHLEGIPKTAESNIKRSQSHLEWCANNPDKVKARGMKTRGENHYHWKGGITCINKSIRLMNENRKWMDAIKARDGKCLVCGITDNLESHHIIPLAVLIENYNIKNRGEARNCFALWDLENGMTLCSKHHYQVHGRKYAD
jgi:5-methylcytosine-specific restriction endonuclease McrA